MIYWSPNQVHSFLRFFFPIISFYFALAHYHPLPQYCCLNSLIISIFWSMIPSLSFSGIPLLSDFFLHIAQVLIPLILPQTITQTFNLLIICYYTSGISRIPACSLWYTERNYHLIPLSSQPHIYACTYG